MNQQVGSKRDLYNGFGDAMGRAIEFAGVPVLFALLGVWLDGRLGTSPIFLVALVVFGIVGVTLRSYYQYKARMESIEAGSVWGKR